MGPMMSRRWPVGDKDISGCAIAGAISTDGRRFSGEMIMRAIANMHERGNGLGGGFAAYGIYPEMADFYCLHVMYDDLKAKQEAERVIDKWANVEAEESIPTRAHPRVLNRPLLHRYFLRIKPEVIEHRSPTEEDDLVVELVMEINTGVPGGFVFSSGKNMGVFKGVGFPEDLGEFYRLEEYEGYMWTSHSRFPTNTSGWWGGAHPFSILDWSVVHNGEISSYGINKRYLAHFGYICTLHTDTEVIAYLFDLLVRKHRLPFEAACLAMAPPFWDQIERMPERQRKLCEAVRAIYGSALLNGPFSVLVAYSGGMVGFNDRTKLRPMVAARKGDMVFMASEEGAIREVCPDPEEVWHATGGLPVIATLKEPEKVIGPEAASKIATYTWAAGCATTSEGQQWL